MQPAFADKTGEIVPFHFKLIPAHKPDELHANIRSAVARKLPVVLGASPASDLELCIVGGGPSLADTIGEIREFIDAGRGYVAAINGTLKWLLDNGVVPTMCGVCDPSPHMADIVHADPRVTYFLASIVHPSVYDKLLDAGCRIFRWNSSAVPRGLQVLDEVEPDWFTVGGGSTMGLRWLTLGYALGFRKFPLHGMDSSFREKSSHAYPDHQDNKEWINFAGYQTRVNFIGQVSDFIGWMDRLMEADVDPVAITVHGTGLLQDKFREWKERNPGCHEEGVPKPVRKLLTDDFRWPAGDTDGKTAALEDVKYMDQFLAYVPRTGVAVQAGGNVGVYPAYLARRFNAVHTFEPDPVNYACLTENIAKVSGNINAVNAALGDHDETCDLINYNPRNCGTVSIAPDVLGPIQMRTIDGLDLHACDLLWLDVEGWETYVLEGAKKTIEKFWPAVIVEESDLCLKYGLPLEGANNWLYAHGYVSVLKLGNDRLFLPTGGTLPGSREAEKAKYEKAWADFPHYRAFSPGEQLVERAVETLGMTPLVDPEIIETFGMDLALDDNSIIDFGCGPGRATKRFADLGYKVLGVDIASNCLDPDINVPFREECLWELPADLKADYGFCCDVMEHIPPDKVRDVLAGIRRATTNGVFFQIAFGDENFGQQMGEKLHLTIQNHEWWLDAIGKFWPNVELIWGDPREIALRGIIVAKPAND